MKTNPNDWVTPLESTAHTFNFEQRAGSGLTKRELFAAMAMQGLCAGMSARQDVEEVQSLAKCCVFAADALIAELNKTEGE